MSIQNVTKLCVHLWSFVLFKCYQFQNFHVSITTYVCILFLKVMKKIAHNKWKMEKTCHAMNCVLFQVGPSTKCFELNGHQITHPKEIGSIKVVQ